MSDMGKARSPCAAIGLDRSTTQLSHSKSRATRLPTPLDIIYLIISFADFDTVKSMSAVSRDLRQMTQSRLWTSSTIETDAVTARTERMPLKLLFIVALERSRFLRHLNIKLRDSPAGSSKVIDQEAAYFLLAIRPHLRLLPKLRSVSFLGMRCCNSLIGALNQFVFYNDRKTFWQEHPAIDTLAFPSMPRPVWWDSIATKDHDLPALKYLVPPTPAQLDTVSGRPVEGLVIIIPDSQDIYRPLVEWPLNESTGPLRALRLINAIEEPLPSHEVTPLVASIKTLREVELQNHLCNATEFALMIIDLGELPDLEVLSWRTTWFQTLPSAWEQFDTIMQAILAHSRALDMFALNTKPAHECAKVVL